MTEIVVAWGEVGDSKRLGEKRKEEMFEGNRFACYLDCGDDYTCLNSSNHLFIYLNGYLLIYFERETERNNMSRAGAEREGKRESQTGSVLTAQSLMWSLIPQIMRP